MEKIVEIKLEPLSLIYSIAINVKEMKEKKKNCNIKIFLIFLKREIKLHLEWFGFTSKSRYCQQIGKTILKIFSMKKAISLQFLLLLRYVSAWPYELFFKQGKEAHTILAVLTAAPEVIFSWTTLQLLKTFQDIFTENMSKYLLS